MTKRNNNRQNFEDDEEKKFMDFVTILCKTRKKVVDKNECLRLYRMNEAFLNGTNEYIHALYISGYTNCEIECFFDPDKGEIENLKEFLKLVKKNQERTNKNDK